MIIKYGKSVADIKSSKQKYFDDNLLLVEAQNESAEIYKKQPARLKCKNCKADILESIKYESHGLEYVICKSCGHVQGLFEETAEYSNYMYSSSNYGKYMYASEEEQSIYDNRVDLVYKPKADFLVEVLDEENDALSVLDIGGGAGFFVSACSDLGIVAHGVDMSQTEVEYGNTYLHRIDGSKLELIQPEELLDIIKNTTANVISAIGVLEHLIDYHSIFTAVKQNRNIKYFYIMVPTFGLSNVLETLTPDVYNRHLGGPHTHVFSTESIGYLCHKYQMEMMGEWKFGTDILDLYRMCMTKNNKQFGEVIHKKFYECIDEMQLVLDKHDFSSEVHFILKTNNL